MRIREPGLHYHVIARCNNGDRIFVKAKDCLRALDFIGHYFRKYACPLYQYAIMPSHIHLMLMTAPGVMLDELMHDVWLAISKNINGRHRRGGHLWRHRYRSRVIKDDRHALACLRYQDRNAVVAGLAASAEEWRWCGYGFYARGKRNALLTPHPSYDLLGRTDAERQAAYRALVLDDGGDDCDRRFFEGRLREGSRRFKELSSDVIDAVTTVLVKHRYGPRWGE